MSYDKAKYHYGADDFPEELPITQGGVHMAFFLSLDVGKRVCRRRFAGGWR
ncbi:DUF7832 domain-containing protein [Commensalibacter communis]|uniref:DUF7832 domain-containing protein n=1 Tax=Commensalibacter communis TaxID=2972786 RepID=UPI00232FEE8D|nr:hypothetical protein [Commensalibacter communis]